MDAGQVRPQDLAVQNSRVEGRAWTWAVQGPSGGCAVAVKYWRIVVAEMLEKEALQIEFQFEVCIHMAEACKS